MSDTEERNRLRGVGYMEQNEKAGAFSCGTCKYFDGDDGCNNVAVQALVSPGHGCCNLFYPEGERPRSEDEWAHST